MFGGMGLGCSAKSSEVVEKHGYVDFNRSYGGSGGYDYSYLDNTTGEILALNAELTLFGTTSYKPAFSFDMFDDDTKVQGLVSLGIFVLEITPNVISGPVWCGPSDINGSYVVIDAVGEYFDLYPLLNTAGVNTLEWVVPIGQEISKVYFSLDERDNATGLFNFESTFRVYTKSA